MYYDNNVSNMGSIVYCALVIKCKPEFISGYKFRGFDIVGYDTGSVFKADYLAI